LAAKALSLQAMFLTSRLILVALLFKHLLIKVAHCKMPHQRGNMEWLAR